MISNEMIDKLANLSMLEFEEDEKQEMRTELEKMILLIEKLNELDCTGIEPLRHVSDNQDVFREDVITEKISRQDAFKNAPVHDNNFFKVPKVIKK